MKIKFLNRFLVLLVIVTLLAGSGLALAAEPPSMVPCGVDKDNNGVLDANEACKFSDFLKMINGIVTGVIIVISAYAAVSFMYAGYAYLTSGGSSEKVSYAKGIFKKVLMGYIIILIAWLFIYMIEQTLFSEAMKTGSFLGSGKPK